MRVCLTAAFDISMHSCAICKFCLLVLEIFSLTLARISLSFALLTLHIPDGSIILLILLMESQKKFRVLKRGFCLLKMILKQNLYRIVLHLNLLSELL